MKSIEFITIVDDQSNPSIISTELADKLNAEGPEVLSGSITFQPAEAPRKSDTRGD